MNTIRYCAYTLLYLLYSQVAIASDFSCTFDKIPTIAGLYQADASCTDGTWTHFYQSDESLLLLSVKMDSQLQLAPEDVWVGLTADGLVHDLSNLPYTSSNVPWIVMSRYWKATPLVQSENETQVRMYYSVSDFSNIKEIINQQGGNIIDNQDLILFTFNEGIDPNPAANTPHEGASKSDFIQANHLSGNLNSTVFYAEFGVDLLTSGGAGGSTVENVLPIELADFELAESEGRVELRWTTLSETNNQYFYILRSLDGFDFISVDRIDGAGTTTESRQYLASDFRPWLGQNYYRLKQVDFDGKQQLSEIKTIKYRGNRVIDIVPTKVKNQTRIEIPQAFDTWTKIQVFDTHGNAVLVKWMEAGQYHFVLDCSMLSVGNYLVKVSDGNIFLSKRFIKVH